MNAENIRLKNRDISWLAFNHRVLQEAADRNVPLYERIKFLAIWSSNLDEFFRVRVASLRALQRLKKKTRKKLDVEPDKLLKRLVKAATLQQEEFGEIFRGQIRKELKKERIIFLRENELDESQKEFARDVLRREIKSRLTPILLHESDGAPFLENKAVYLVVRLRNKESDKKDPEELALVEVPSTLSRFILLPESDGHFYVMFVDDVIRMSLGEVFADHFVLGVHAVKLTRDAELNIEDEMSGDLLDKVKKAIKKRKEGVPSRFLYDSDMPKKTLVRLQTVLQLNDDDLVLGGRYHNFSDFFSFPNPKSPTLTYEPMNPLEVMTCETGASVFDQLSRREMLAHYPYHSYDCVLRFLQEAADDPNVSSISITLYRVAKNSEVVHQLLRAANNGKRVTAFVEVKARFDEESNIYWAEEMQRAGAKVLYSIPNLKVHAKLLLIERQEGNEQKAYAYLSTGNFNENAATLYTDFGFFTSDVRLTAEMKKVFEILCRERERANFKHLLVPPFSMRQTFEALIAREIKNAGKGREAYIIAKMNSLEDPDMIAQLYEASSTGVKIQLIVRGICCLIPGVKGMSENIEVISIIDRYLEHSRVFIFCNGGDELCYLSSADWMRRNLDRRIEVAFPIYDKEVQRCIRATLDLQLHDNVKARIINKKLDNAFRSTKHEDALRSQYATYEFWKKESNRKEGQQ